MAGDRGVFDPILGRIGEPGHRKSGKYLGRILAASTRAGPRASQKAKAFSGSRIGRGAPIGRLLASRGAGAARHVRRTSVIVAVPRLAGRGLAAARRHLRYIQRDGVTRDGAPGELYSAREDRANGRQFIERSIDDRHQFRIILSADEGDLYEDLKPVVRRFLSQVEKDLHTRLDWVAADHFNTGKPHSHIVIRGRNDLGGDLIIAREYLSSGMAERASEIVALDLGPKSQLEIAARAQLDVHQHRMTEIDRTLLREAEMSETVSAAVHSPFEQARRAGRLQMLERFGLAEEVRPGRWRIDADLQRTLTTMKERRDLTERIHQRLVDRGKRGLAGDYVLHDDAAPLRESLIGRVAFYGNVCEDRDRRHVLLEAVDGRQHFLTFSGEDHAAHLPQDSIVKASPARSGTPDLVLEILSPVPLDRLVDAEAVTWLDRQPVAGPLAMCRDKGFGSDVTQAMEQRCRWLVEHGWADMERGQLVYRGNAFDELGRCEIARLAVAIAEESGLEYAGPGPHPRFAGLVTRKLDSEGGQYMLVENAHQFALLPWSTGLEASIGRGVEGIAHEDSFDWSPARSLSQGGPHIS